MVRQVAAFTSLAGSRTHSRRGARLLRSFLAFINKDSIYVGVINTIGKAGASTYVARRLATDSRRGARLLRLFVAEGRTDGWKEGRKEWSEKDSAIV